MRQIIVFAFVAGLQLSMSPLAAAQVPGAATQSQTAIGGAVPNPAQAVISGNVVSLGGEPLTNTVVQARNLLTGALGGSTTTTTDGQFALDVDPGSYMLEILDAGGQIIGTSSFIAATAGATIAAATVIATSSVLGVVSSVTGLAAAFGAQAAAPGLTMVATAAGVAGAVVPPAVSIASPSQ